MGVAKTLATTTTMMSQTGGSKNLKTGRAGIRLFPDGAGQWWGDQCSRAIKFRRHVVILHTIETTTGIGIDTCFDGRRRVVVIVIGGRGGGIRWGWQVRTPFLYHLSFDPW